jgi:hypothetical protein
MKYEYYQLRAQSYFSDGIYIWEDIDAQCETLEDCLKCKEYAISNNPEYVDYEIIHRIETVVNSATQGIESDWDR